VPVKVGFIGAGGRTVAEMRDLIKMPEAEMVAVCDIDELRCQAAVHQVNEGLAPGQHPWRPRLFTDYRKMLESVGLDAVYISLPPFVHGEIDHAVIEAGKAVLIEKPLAVELSVAKEINDHIRQKGVVNSVGYQMRYAAATQQTRVLLQGVPIGMVVAVRWGGLPGTPWWRKQRQSGGMLIEQHTHGVDLVRFYVGEPDTIYAAADTLLLKDVPDLDIFDVNAVTVRFRNGAVGLIGNSPAATAGAPPELAHHIHILAKDLTISAGFGQSIVRRPGQQPETLTSPENPNFLMNKAFVEAVAKKDMSGILSPYEDALRSFAFTYAAQKSAEWRREVRLTENLEVV